MDVMSTPTLPIDLAGVVAFVRVAEAGSFAEAARRAGTTTSAMSKAISPLRARARLAPFSPHHPFHRADRGGRSAAGKRTRADRRGSTVRRRAQRRRRGRGSGRVRITAPASFARACILPDCRASSAANPGLEIEVKFRNELLDLAAEGVDIAMRSGALDGLPGHRAQKLLTFPWIACAAPAYLSPRDPEDPRRPRGARPRRLPQSRDRSDPDLALRRSGRRRDAALHTEAAATFRRRARRDGTDREGFGVGWGPAWLIGDDLREGRVVEVLPDWRVPEEPLWLLRSSIGRRPSARGARWRSCRACRKAGASSGKTVALYSIPNVLQRFCNAACAVRLTDDERASRQREPAAADLSRRAPVPRRERPPQPRRPRAARGAFEEVGARGRKLGSAQSPLGGERGWPDRLGKDCDPRNRRRPRG